MDNLILCNHCKNYLTKDKFYPVESHKKTGTCKNCNNENDRRKKDEERSKCCGGNLIYNQPNIYFDIHQKKCVFDFLPLLGYQFCEETGIWWKEGIKDKNGNFLNLKPYRQYGKKLPPTMIKNIINMYLSGMRIINIAKKVGISYQTCRIHIRAYEQSTDRGTGNTE